MGKNLIKHSSPSFGSFPVVDLLDLNSQLVGPHIYQSSASQQIDIWLPHSSIPSIEAKPHPSLIQNVISGSLKNSLKHCILLLHLILTSSPCRTVISSRLAQSNPTCLACAFLPVVKKQRKQSRPGAYEGWDLLRKKSCEKIVRASFTFRSCWRDWWEIIWRSGSRGDIFLWN